MFLVAKLSTEPFRHVRYRLPPLFLLCYIIFKWGVKSPPLVNVTFTIQAKYGARSISKFSFKGDTFLS